MRYARPAIVCFHSPMCTLSNMVIVHLLLGRCAFHSPVHCTRVHEQHNELEGG